MTQEFCRIAKDKKALLVIAMFLIPFVVFGLVGAVTVGLFFAEIVASYFLLWGLMALLSRTPQAELRNRFLLSTATLFVTLAVLEVPGIIGILEYPSVFRTPSDNPWEEPGRVFDDALLWRSKPHYQSHINFTRGNIAAALCSPPGPEREYDIQYDQNGFRNAEDFVTADIAIIGDSYVESPMMEYSLIMPSVLAQLEKKTVVNLGMSGYGPKQELITLQRYVPQLHPRTVVWVFYGGNDLSDVLQYERYKEIAAGKNSLSNIFDRSLIKNLLANVFRASKECIPRPEYKERYGIIRDGESQQRRVYFVGTNSDLVPLDSAALETTRSIIRKANQLCEEEGIHLVFVYAPDTFSVYSGLSNLIEVSDEVKRWKVSDLQDQLRAIVGEISPKIDYLDLTPDFKRAVEKDSRIFLEDDTHWTEEGHRVVAEAIHRLLSSHPPKVKSS